MSEDQSNEGPTSASRRGKRKRPYEGRQKRGRRAVKLKSLAALDQRTFAARRALEFQAGLEGDLGGADRISVSERQIVQHAACLAAVIEDLEAHWLAGDDIDQSSLLAAINCQRRLFEAVGLERRVRDVTPNLKNYLAGKADAGHVNGMIDVNHKADIPDIEDIEAEVEDPSP